MQERLVILSISFEGIGKLFSGGLGGLGNFDFFGGPGGSSSLFEDFGSLFMASGGSVFGPGTGTSDSIPAMLSNGEYVVNAAKTARFRPLLEAINSNRLSHLAAGGLVGVAPSQSELATVSSQSQQVFNINITGDISRQTRSEIQKMLPNIATGVNMYNAEQGRRR